MAAMTNDRVPHPRDVLVFVARAGYHQSKPESFEWSLPREADSYPAALCIDVRKRELAPGQASPLATPSPDSQYRLGPDSMPQDGVPKGEIRGPFTLPSKVYPGTQHTYWVYVPAQYDPAVPASLMIFQDGQAFKDANGDMRAQNVMDNLIYRREIPVMIGVFINPGRTPRAARTQPADEWGDGTTNRPTEYNTPDDKYARVITEELMPALYKDYNISKDPDQHGIGGSSSGAIAAFAVAWERPNDFRKVLSNVGSFVESAAAATSIPSACWPARRSPSASSSATAAMTIAASGPTAPIDDKRDWFYQNVRLMKALTEKGLRRELLLGHESARPEIRRRDPARHDALAVARLAPYRPIPTTKWNAASVKRQPGRRPEVLSSNRVRISGRASRGHRRPREIKSDLTAPSARVYNTSSRPTMKRMVR